MEMPAAVDDPGDDDLPMPASPLYGSQQGRRDRSVTLPDGDLAGSYEAPALARTLTAKINTLASLFPEQHTPQQSPRAGDSDVWQSAGLQENMLDADSQDGGLAPLPAGLKAHLKHSDENDALSPKDIGPFGKPTIFSRTAARTEPRNRDDQAAEPKAEDATAPQLDDNSMAGDAAGGAKGISATVESCIVILTAIAMGAVLYVLGDVLVPLILAVFVSSMLVPLLDLLTDRPLRLCNRYWCDKFWCGPVLGVEQRCFDRNGSFLDKRGHEVCSFVTSVITLRLPNVLALLVVLAGVGILLTVSGFLLFQSIEPFVSHAQQYEDSVEDIGNGIMRAFSAENETLKQYTKSQIMQQTERDESVAGAAGTGALIMMYVIFILLGRQARGQRKGRKVTYAVEHQLKVYVSWKFIISAVTGILIGTTLSLLHCDLAALFGFLVFGLNFIPTVGLLAAVLLPLPLVILAPRCPDVCWNEDGTTEGKWPYDQSDFQVHFKSCREASCCGDWEPPDDPQPGPCGGANYGMQQFEKIFAVAIPYLINVIVSNFVEPMVFGRRLNLHPVVVLFALVFWYMMWGIPGAFLSVPIVSVLKILCLNMDNLTAQWFARLLEGDVEKHGSGQSSEYYAYDPPKLREGQDIGNSMYLSMGNDDDDGL